MDFCLDVVSDQRDPLHWPNPNNYEITLNRELYNVTNIKLIAAQIPLSQTLINESNNTFPINDTYVNLPNVNIDSGEDFADFLQANLSGTAVSNVEYNSNTETLTYSNVGGNSINFDFYNGHNGYTTPTKTGTLANELGFPHSNVTNNSSVITSGPINIFGPTSIVIKLSTNGDDITRDVYNSGPSNVSVGPKLPSHGLPTAVRTLQVSSPTALVTGWVRWKTPRSPRWLSRWSFARARPRCPR